MGVSLAANGLSIVHKGSGGVANACTPDVCNTTSGKSTSAIAYPNTAMSSNLSGGTTSVSADGGNSLAIEGSTFSKSTGDEGGDKKGVKSKTIKGEAKFTTASPTVQADGKGVCRLSDQMSMNKDNTMCLAGVDNPSVSASDDDIGTFTIDLKCAYPCGTALKNAPFELLDENGDIIRQGTTNEKGEAVVSGLSEGTISVRFKETDQEYCFIGPLEVQDKSEEYNDNYTYFSAAAGDKCLFWENKIEASQYWGILSSKNHSDTEIEDMLALSARAISPIQATSQQYNLFITEFISTLNKLESDRSDTELYVPLFEALLPLCHIHGDKLLSLAQYDGTQAHFTLLAVMRNLGDGNAHDGINHLDWKGVSQELSQFIFDISEDLTKRLEALRFYSFTENYSVIDETIVHYFNSLENMKQVVPSLLTEIANEIGNQLKHAIASSEGYVITSVTNSTFSTASGQVVAVVKTEPASALLQPLFSFDNLFCD